MKKRGGFSVVRNEGESAGQVVLVLKLRSRRSPALGLFLMKERGEPMKKRG